MRVVDPARHDERRRAILRAAARCIADKGFHAASTADIRTAAGVSTGTLFHYFPGKQAIAAAIVDLEGEEVRELLDGLAADVAAGGSALAALRHVLDAVVDHAADPANVRLALELAAEAARDSDLARHIARNDAALQEGMRALLATAAARREAGADPTLDVRAAAAWIGVLIDGFFNRAALDPGFRVGEQRAALHRLVASLIGSCSMGVR
ncbi:TetR/AcrR family transcriptional regulator [Azospirillum thermophilum]|uniref:TetR family transcriptional regulator n=1 Tax=Azospirillum thermophilum TaxID=2202148 RepID=A0A2S2CQ74_9PROT|nr:TetR/AcrR family transcriptional regulator [Azospirillum thermophilum]AWK86626.1 TetR family transcriptional regulator [Azospirillum thermophilum]